METCIKAMWWLVKSTWMKLIDDLMTPHLPPQTTWVTWWTLWACSPLAPCSTSSPCSELNQKTTGRRRNCCLAAWPPPSLPSDSSTTNYNREEKGWTLCAAALRAASCTYRQVWPFSWVVNEECALYVKGLIVTAPQGSVWGFSIMGLWSFKGTEVKIRVGRDFFLYRLALN